LVIKRLLPGARSEADYDLLRHEAELHRLVDHDNVVEVFGAGMIQGEPYLAMEYVEGVDAFRLLRAAQAENQRIPAHVVAHVARKVADALEAVHATRAPDGTDLDIVHGDVSPSNVYLSLAGNVKLGDFGIARTMQRAHAGSASLGAKGKWGYVAPEILEGQHYDRRADLFSLAAMTGELLIGEPIFPGSGQLAVLLSIRDANIEPLKRAAAALPDGLFDVLARALSREPLRRQQTAAALSADLAAFTGGPEQTARDLAQWVAWSSDSKRLAERLEGRIRDSVKRLRAVRQVDAPEQDRVSSPDSIGSHSKVRMQSGELLEDVPFSKIVEMIATGALHGRDEVALMGGGFRPVEDIDELARHLLPSTTMKTGRLYEPGVPDFADQLAETTMLTILARMRHQRETGALFVERGDESNSRVRKEIYLRSGRLLHVASSSRDELLGQYLVRRGKLTADQLDQVLAAMESFGGRLGDTILGLKMLDVVDLFRAIRDQGRDRVGQLCAWSAGKVAFYRDTAPGPVQFPLDLDLASAMMAGAIFASEGKPESLLPDAGARVLAGPEVARARDHRELGTSPITLQRIPPMLDKQPTIAEVVDRLTRPPASGTERVVRPREALAALVVARELGWISFEG
jgi:serine/threonine-protein kinase